VANVATSFAESRRFPTYGGGVLWRTVWNTPRGSSYRRQGKRNLCVFPPIDLVLENELDEISAKSVDDHNDLAILGRQLKYTAETPLNKEETELKRNNRAETVEVAIPHSGISRKKQEEIVQGFLTYHRQWQAIVRGDHGKQPVLQRPLVEVKDHAALLPKDEPVETVSDAIDHARDEEGSATAAVWPEIPPHASLAGCKRWILDTGASQHMISSKQVDMAYSIPASRPYKLATANGKIEADRLFWAYIPVLGQAIEAVVLDSTPAAISTGALCAEGWQFSMDHRGAVLTNPEGIIIPTFVEHNVPYAMNLTEELRAR